MRRWHKLGHRAVVGLLLTALVVEAVAIAWLVLNPSPAFPTRSVVVVTDWLAAHGFPSWVANEDRVEFSLNVALFVPTGATLRLLAPKVYWWVWIVVGFVVSGGIELFQLHYLDARSATWRDVWANTIGFGGGAALVAAVQLLWWLVRKIYVSRLRGARMGGSLIPGVVSLTGRKESNPTEAKPDRRRDFT